MMIMYRLLNLEFSDVNPLCKLCENAPFEVDISSGRIVVDGRSAMGVMGLVGRTVRIEPLTNDVEELRDFFELLDSRLKTYTEE